METNQVPEVRQHDASAGAVVQSSLDFDTAYPDGFWRWYEKNKTVYREFERQALVMARKGRERYSARTIIEVMRWQSDIADTTTLFKINDHFTPGMSRLWMNTHGETHPKFFEIRR